jgi:hypothetical protein
VAQYQFSPGQSANRVLCRAQQRDKMNCCKLQVELIHCVFCAFSVSLNCSVLNTPSFCCRMHRRRTMRI